MNKFDDTSSFSLAGDIFEVEIWTERNTDILHVVKILTEELKINFLHEDEISEEDKVKVLKHLDEIISQAAEESILIKKTQEGILFCCNYSLGNEKLLDPQPFGP